MSEVDVKLNKWHIAMEKSYRKPTKTEHNLKKNYARQWDWTTHLKLSRRELSNELAGNSVELV